MTAGRRALFVALLALISVVGTACGIHKSSRAALLDARELGPGWVERAGHVPADSDRMCGAGNALSRAEAVAGGSVDFAWTTFVAPDELQPNPDTSVYIHQGIVVMDSPEQVDELIARSEAAFTACPRDLLVDQYTRDGASIDGYRWSTVVDPPEGADFAYAQTTTPIDSVSVSQAGFTAYAGVGTVLVIFGYAEHTGGSDRGIPDAQSAPPAWWFDAFAAAIDKVETTIRPHVTT